MSSLLVKNGTVVTATDRYQADVFIEGERISMIGTKLDVTADREIDASGCYLFPGGIDAHTHMELPFMGTHASDSFESGTLAGLHGGTTTIIDFAIQTQGESLEAAIEAWHKKPTGMRWEIMPFTAPSRTSMTIPAKNCRTSSISTASIHSRSSWPTRAH